MNEMTRAAPWSAVLQTVSEARASFESTLNTEEWARYRRSRPAASGTRCADPPCRRRHSMKLRILAPSLGIVGGRT